MKEHPMAPEDIESALSVNPGVSQPPSINKTLIHKLRFQKNPRLTCDQYVEGILAGDRGILSRAITLIESVREEDESLARDIVEKCLPHTGNSVRIGITGVPGVGKSSFIEVFGTHLIEEHGRRVAVLAIDPSSQVSQGSILGDKSRMEMLATNPSAFVRPSPSRGSLGGVARRTRETALLCEAAGFDTLLIETVGVGQSESTVHSMVDFFLLLMLAGAGDELQGIKRGIMEMADAIAITKAEGSNEQRALLAKREYENALHLFPMKHSGWYPKVMTCSALENIGIGDIWKVVAEYSKHMKANGLFGRNRSEQVKNWMHETIEYELKDRFYENVDVIAQMAGMEKAVAEGKISSFTAAKKLLDLYFQNPS
jgi:LAO/AO transport system kinase